MAYCGDGVIASPGEECDDRNNRDYDGCSADCLWERGFCGDGIVQKLLGETCEPALWEPSLSYTCDPSTCTPVFPDCGNSVLNPGEECDAGRSNTDAPGARCRSNCTLARCGDGIVDPPYESCDDRNRLSGDGCDRSCQAERAAPSPQTLAAVIYDLQPDVPTGYAVPGSQANLGTGYPVSTYDLGAYPFPLQASHAPVGDTGPGTLAVMAAGAAGGYAWVRRQRIRGKSAL
jgi:cysteine-rich repeat protein